MKSSNKNSGLLSPQYFAQSSPPAHTTRSSRDQTSSLHSFLLDPKTKKKGTPRRERHPQRSYGGEIVASSKRGGVGRNNWGSAEDALKPFAYPGAIDKGDPNYASSSSSSEEEEATVGVVGGSPLEDPAIVGVARPAPQQQAPQGVYRKVELSELFGGALPQKQEPVAVNHSNNSNKKKSRKQKKKKKNSNKNPNTPPDGEAFAGGAHHNTPHVEHLPIPRTLTPTKKPHTNHTAKQQRSAPNNLAAASADLRAMLNIAAN